MAARGLPSSPLPPPPPHPPHPSEIDLGNDGSIIFEGYIFKSPSAFSVYVKRKQVREGVGFGRAEALPRWGKALRGRFPRRG